MASDLDVGMKCIKIMLVTSNLMFMVRIVEKLLTWHKTCTADAYNLVLYELFSALESPHDLSVLNVV